MILLRSDARHLPLADESVQCCVTSPPYWGLRSYQGDPHMIGLEPTFDKHLANLVDVFREVRRVLRKDGVLFLNYGDAYSSAGGENPQGHTGQMATRTVSQHRGHDRPRSGLKPKDLMMMPARVALALQADGWWVRSEIIWHKPNPMPESVTDRPTNAHEKVFLLTKSARYFYDAEAVRIPVTGWGWWFQVNKIREAWRLAPKSGRVDIRGRASKRCQSPQRLDHPHAGRISRPLRHLPRAASRAVHPRRHERGGRLREVRLAVGAGDLISKRQIVA